MSDSIIVKVTSTSAFFGEPSVIRVILEKMIPGALGQSDREIMFIHRKVEEQSASVEVEIHETGTQSAVKLIEHYLRILMDNPKLTFAVHFTEIKEDGPQTSFAEIVASTEAEAAFKLHLKLAVESADTREADAFKYGSIDYYEALFDELMSGPPAYIGMSQQEYDQRNFLIDELMSIHARQQGWD